MAQRTIERMFQMQRVEERFDRLDREAALSE